MVKNWKVIAMYLAIVTVIMEIIMEMIVMFMNKDNKIIIFHLLLAPDKEHKKVFPDVPDVGFRNGKSLKDYLVIAALPKTNETRRCGPYGKKTCLVCNSMRITKTFTCV